MDRLRLLASFILFFASLSGSFGKDDDGFPNVEEFRERSSRINSTEEVDRLQKEYFNRAWDHYREPTTNDEEKKRKGKSLNRVIVQLDRIAFDRKEWLRQKKADRMADEELFRLVDQGPLEDSLGAIRAVIRKNKPILTPQIAGKLLEWCNNKRPEIRCLAAGGINKFRNVPQILRNVLIRLVSDPDEFVRMNAINSLSDVSPNEVPYCLIQALDGSFAEARTNAHIVLSKYDSNEFEKQQRIVNFLLETPNPGPRGIVYCFQALFSVIGYFTFPCKIFHTHFFFSGLKNPWDP
jgi:hypothetical protein